LSELSQLGQCRELSLKLLRTDVPTLAMSGGEQLRFTIQHQIQRRSWSKTSPFMAVGGLQKRSETCLQMTAVEVMLNRAKLFFAGPLKTSKHSTLHISGRIHTDLPLFGIGD
jgi:hypothetical protein